MPPTGMRRSFRRRSTSSTWVLATTAIRHPWYLAIPSNIDPERVELAWKTIEWLASAEMIAEYTRAKTNELTADELLHTVHAHPTAAEVMLEAVAEARGVSVHI